MTTEISSSLSPDEVLTAVRSFFLGPDRMSDAWLESESDTHVTFCTFRGNLSVAALGGADGTRVRVTTLREEGIVPRLLAYVELRESAA